MKGYIYTMYEGADPGKGWVMNDPIFGSPPTLGACMPNFRRAVNRGDWIFAISGRATGVQQYVVGGFQVVEKINALDAFARFPELRIRKTEDGSILGNIIVDESGRQNPIDKHKNFERRIENYIVGGKQIVVNELSEIEKAREETLPTLNRIFSRKGNRVFDVIGRGRKLDESQIKAMNDWLESVKEG